MQMHFYLVSIFDMADRNGDGKLTEEEIKEYTDLFQDAHGAQVSLSLTSTGRGLFQTLDTNGDGQLSIREMRNSWDRVKEFDRDTDSAIGRNEFPQQFTLSVSTGMNYNVVPPVAFAGTRPAGTMRTPARGPTWFRKMDRNGDGDVSQLEWLGSKEAFARIDTDKDNLISPSEAEAFDAKMRDKE
jgi:Ca2+-binding EF-hand superfamily protein